MLFIGARSGISRAQTTVIPSQLENIAYHWAPFVFAETKMSLSGSHTSFEENLFVAANFDNDLNASNNSTHAQSPNIFNSPSYNREATVYYTAVETGDDDGNGFYYLGYYWYHARDGGAVFDGGHENDLEGTLFIIKKVAYNPYGYLVAALTQAHGGLIPWRSGIWAPFDPGPVGRSWGALFFLNDGRLSGVSRPVVITAAMTHGTYAPQWCTDDPSQPGPDGNLGIDFTATEQVGWGAYYYCPHGADNNMIMYMPAVHPGDPGTQQPANGNGGGATYRLVELLNSPLWPHRSDWDALFTGSALSLYGGNSGYSAFWSTDSPGANPPWQWRGQQSCPWGFCWDTFGEDGTVSGERSATLPVSSFYGGVVTAPDQEAELRFAAMPRPDRPMRYNPYLLSPPDYSIGNHQPGPLTGSISGPSMIPAGMSQTWQAQIGGGTGPYTYQWGGALSGSSSSITGTLFNDDVLYLDVWDAAGAHIALSYPITVCQNGQISC